MSEPSTCSTVLGLPPSLEPADKFAHRHIGPSAAETARMLHELGFASLDGLMDAVVPAGIRLAEPLQLQPSLGEYDALNALRDIAARNQVFRSFIGMGYSDCITPPVIQRNVLENPGWYTQYTPYQAEIAQGRLEALLNFQTMTSDLTGLPIANASLLDEATAAAEAMHLCQNAHPERRVFFVSQTCHPQTLEVVQTRARPLGIEVVVGDHRAFPCDATVFGALVQYPATEGEVFDYEGFARQVHACRWGTAGRTPRFSPRRRPANACCRADWWECPRMAPATPRCAWRCKRANNTSAVKRPPAISARRRPCWPAWPPCTRSITGRTV